MEHLENNGIRGNLVSFTKEDLPLSSDIELRMQDKWKLRDYQEPVAEYLLQKDIKNKMVTLQPGDGKTLISCWAMSKMNKIIVIIIKPAFIDKWIQDVLDKFILKKDEIVAVQGSEQLMSLLHLAKEGKLKQKVIIVSNRTYQNWLKLYERFTDQTLDIGYASIPDDFYKELKAGVRLIDEAHMDLHLGFKTDLYTNVEESISLSATMLSDNPFIDKMQNIMYPKLDRYKGGELKKYVESYAISYGLSNPDRINTTEYGSVNYSHGAFEKSILKNTEFTKNYIDLIQWVMDIGYFKMIKKDKKLAVFAASVDMCTRLTDHFKSKYPDLDIRRYCQDDPYENLIEPDIRFTTILSGGTAHDIPGLTNVILTIAISSIQANIQTFGRLRAIEDSNVEFHYFVCKDLVKHINYHEEKIKMLQHRAKSFNIIDSRRTV
jgi:hypothetical protein